MLALQRLAEPPLTARLHALLATARETLTPWQRAELARSGDTGPFDRSHVQALGADLDHPARIRVHHAQLVRRRKRPARVEPDAFDRIPSLFAHAATRPSIVSAAVWASFGEVDPELASMLVHLVRGRAGLPGLRSELVADDPGVRAAGGRLELLAARFADRQAEDACAWLERIPAPLGPDDGATLSAQHAAIEAARAAAPRIAADVLAGFLRRAASYFVQLSTRGLDPLGFPLGREAQVEASPDVERRIELAAWARRAGNRISPRGQLLVLTLPVLAPWPLRLELIAAELGHGQTGSVVLLLRLDAGGTVAVTSHAPALLCFPGEPPEELGPRFERWLAMAYPQATEAWRAWC